MKCAMWNAKCAMRKSGVSLITVLLFMLVATIAATATYKWITSEGHSSASRMLEREAYQSSVAGIETAVSWMTFHANDVGALIRQYKTSGNAAISLDNQLAPLVRAGQNFHVWLTGVNASGGSYKVKLVSEGIARNGAASHSEVAILNVDGLYKEKIPTTKGAINFDKAFQGGVGKFVANDRVQSAIVNGDFKGNQPRVDNEFIVTGDVVYEGKTEVPNGGDIYIGGDLTYSSKFEVGSNANKVVVYVGGNLVCSGSDGVIVYGDLHVNGSIPADCPIDVSGNLTVGATLYRADADYTFTVGNNLVFKKTGLFSWTGPGYADSQKGVQNGNSYLANIYGQNNDGKRKIKLGSKVYLYSSFPSNIRACQNEDCPSEYCEGFFTTCAEKTNDVCTGYWMGMCTGHKYGYYGNVGSTSTRYFSFYVPQPNWDFDDATGSRTGIVQTERISDWKNTDGVLKDVGNNYWKNIKRMEDYGKVIDPDNGTVPTAIRLKNLSTADINQHKYTCAGVTSGSNLGFSDDIIGLINDCYQTADGAGDLFNGFLILDLNFTEKKDPTKSLEGNFVFIMRGNSMLSLPSVKEGYAVLLYFPDGHSGDIMRGTPDNCTTVNGVETCDPYNYFIYSDGDINQFLSFGNKPITGSVVIANPHQLKTSQGGSSFQFKKSVLDALAAADLIEENPDYTALVNPGAAGAGVGIAGAGAPDDYYIAIAPQLSITVETQYTNKESIDNLAANQQSPEGSFIVLPRIIRLNRTAVGKLKDYYNILLLNGGKQLKGQSVSCDGAIPTGDDELSPDSHHKLAAGNYTCTVSGRVAMADDDNGGSEITVPFYVVVSASEADGPEVSFAEGLKELKKGDQYNVQLRVTVQSPAVNYVVKVKFPEYENDQWTITPAAGIVAAGCEENAVCTFTIPSSQALHTIFTVENTNAVSGQLTFEFDSDYLSTPPTNFDIGSPYMESIIASTKINVQRASLEAWCSIAANSEDAFCARKNDPPCDVSAQWINADGSNCSVTTPNDVWSCKNTAEISLKRVYENIPQGCEAVIPGTNKATPPFGDVESITLYASLLAKPFWFKTGFASATGTTISGNPTIHVSVSRNDEVVTTKDCSKNNFGNSTENAENCQVQVYYGDRVTLSFPNASDPSDNTPPAGFSYWMCESGADCPTPSAPSPTNSYSISVTGANTVYAHFNEQDKHCFFDIFRERNSDNSGSYENRTHVICGESGSDGEYCIDADGKHTNAKWKLQSGSATDIEFNGDGRISLASASTRTKNESAKPFVTVMSRVKAGTYGMLKAQFEVPREGIASGDIAKSTVKQSGFILRSTENVSSYLMLNVFSASNGKLMARVCLNGNTPCKEQQIGDATAQVGDIILMTATIGKSQGSVIGEPGGTDILEVRAYTDKFNTNSQVTNFELTQGNLDGVQNLAGQSNEYVGFRLSDQNFKIYGIGWKSDDYASECWDTPPVITCSFKAKYAGGIVPLNKDVSPWVGFSKWFGDGYTNQCQPIYYYNGADASYCNGSTLGETNFMECSGTQYKFTQEGAHGGADNTALVGANSYCGTVKGEIAPWLNSVAANCGPFWVGQLNHCEQHARFTATVQGLEGNYFGLSSTSGTTATANLREAEVVVEMDNPNGAEVEIYLFSQNATSGYTYGSDPIYSLPYTTNSAGDGVRVNVDIEAISRADGFDPEKVVGVYVKHDGTVTNISVHSRCPHALSLKSCRAEYNKDNGKWTVTAEVKSHEDRAGAMDVPKVKIGDNETNLTGNGRDCSLADQCEWTSDEISWELALSNTPYQDMGSSSSMDYVFTVTLNEKGTPVTAAEGSPCKTEKATVTGITTSCSINKNKVAPGAGIPVMTYSITGCPTKNATEDPKCKYRVRLMKGTTVVSDVNPIVEDNAVSGNVSNRVTESNKANDGDYDDLAEGDDYKLVLESTNAKYPFPSCEKTFKVVAAGSECTKSNHIIPSQNSNITINGSFSAGCYELYTGKACSKAQINSATGSGKIVINGKDFDCSYVASTSITANSTITLEVPEGCSMGDLYVSDCETVESSSSAESSGSEESSSSAESSGSVASSSSAVGISAACEIYDNNGSSTSSVFTETGNMKFKVTTHTATEGTKCLFTGTESKWNGSANANAEISEDLWLNVDNGVPKSTERGFAAPAAAGTYTYTVSLNGSNLCSATLTTTAPLTCSAPAQVPLGGSFTLTGTYSGTSCKKGYTRNMSGTGTEYPGELACDNLSQSFTVTSTTPGNYNYLIGVDGSPNATCTKTVQVVRKEPTFECKTGLKATIGESNNVIITLKDITQCGGETSNWCHSSITGDDISVQNGINVGDGTVNLGAFTDTGTDGVSKSYTVTLENSIGVSDAQTCSVEFTAGSSNTMVDFVYDGDHYDFEAGTTYEIQSCSGSGRNMTCAAAGGGKKLFVDEVEKYETPSWMTITQYQNMNWQCSVGQIVTVTGGTMRCKMQW